MVWIMGLVKLIAVEINKETVITVEGRLGRSGSEGGKSHLKLQLYYLRNSQNFWSHNLCSELLFLEHPYGRY